MVKSAMQVLAELFDLVDQDEALAAARDPVECAYYAQTDRVAHKWHHYLSVYHHHLARFRDTPVRLLEIGVHNGGSLQMWRRYLGPRAIIHALDNNPDCAAIDDPDVTVHIGSQDDAARLHAIVEAMGGVDVVIDDGSHKWTHQIATFEALYGKVSERGVYICEDTHTSYWPEYGSEGASFVDHARARVDQLHAWYSLAEKAPDAAFARQTRSVTFYDSQVVFEKEPRLRPRNTFVGQRCVT